MYEFETKVDFLGEERPAKVAWDWAEDQVWVQGIEIALILERDWTPRGEYKRWRERFVVDVKTILSDDQISDFARQIKAAEVKRAAEEFSDGRLLDWEWRNRRLRAAS